MTRRRTRELTMAMAAMTPGAKVLPPLDVDDEVMVEILAPVTDHWPPPDT